MCGRIPPARPATLRPARPPPRPIRSSSSSERTETASGVSRATASRRRIRPPAKSQSVRIVRRIRRGLAGFWTTQMEGDSDQRGEPPPCDERPEYEVGNPKPGEQGLRDG